MPRAALAMSIEAEERLGSEIGGGHLGHVLAGAVGDHHDIGRARRAPAGRRSGARASVGHASASRARLSRSRAPRRPRPAARRRARPRPPQCRRDSARRSTPSPCVEIDVAQEPDQPVEQQVLHRLIELELQLAGNLVVERVDLAVERDHAVAVAHGGKRGCDRWPPRRRSGRRCAPAARAPPRLIMELASWVAMISRRSRWCSTASGNCSVTGRGK